MRVFRNIAIIAVLAAPIAFLPQGGNAADAILATLMLVFLATLVAGARQFHRENRMTFDTLPDAERAVLFGGIGVIVLMAVGADEMLGGGGAGAILWVTLVACAIVAIASIWTRARSL